jgi:NCK adaptor protein
MCPCSNDRVSVFTGGKSNAEETYVIAKYDYVATGTHELDIKRNERLLLLDDSKHWWIVQNARNQSGYVPSNYVKREKPSIFDSIKKRVKKSTSSASGSKTLPTVGQPGGPQDNPNLSPVSSPSRRPPPPQPPLDSRDGIGFAIVKYNYHAQQPDELSLVKGTRVVIIEKSNDGWWVSTLR